MMGHMRWGLVAVLAACVEPHLVPCGSLSCPVGTVCVANQVCARAEEIAACEGLEDNASCVVDGSVGTCRGRVCAPSGCGNGVIDPVELCDDGNVVSGDGCRADCRKVEVCGDGEVDEGESCDDENDNPADGCDACAATTWLATTRVGIGSDTRAGVAQPTGVVFDAAGNVYIADTGTHRVLRVSPDGVATVVAGTGRAGFSGDGGPATAASLSMPSAVAITLDGGLVIADSGNNRVRLINVDGTIHTIAGDGTPAFDGDGGLAVDASLWSPVGISVGAAGELYVSDSYNQVVRKIDHGIISTIAGTPSTGGWAGDGGPATSALLYYPEGIALDSAGNLYIADLYNASIRRVATDGTISTFAGNGSYGSMGDGGPATSAQLSYVIGVAVDTVGNVFIADSYNHKIRRVDINGTITTVAGTGTDGYASDGLAAIDALLSVPVGVAASASGEICIADLGNGRVRRVDGDGIITTLAGARFGGDGAAATSATLDSTSGLAIDANGLLYIADTDNNRIRRVDAQGVISTIAGSTPGFSGDAGPALAARIHGPRGLAFDPSGALVIADTLNHRVRRISPQGVITTIAGTGTPGATGDGSAAIDAELDEPSAIAVDATGAIYVADTNNNAIRRIDSAGMISTVAAGALSKPTGVAIDSAGTLYIADTENHRIQQVTNLGAVSTFAGTGVDGFDGDGTATAKRLSRPAGLAIDAAGTLYVADRGGARVRAISGGTITTLAGTTAAAHLGDGAAAAAASVISPVAIAIGPDGAIYVSDAGDSMVRRIRNGIITTVAGAIDPAWTGPLATARLADPQAVVHAAPFMLFAGGESGTVEVIRTGSGWVSAIAGAYPQPSPTGQLARFRSSGFGTVGGVAYDATTETIFLTNADSLVAISAVALADEQTWTLAHLTSLTGHADGALSTAAFNQPTGLFLDEASRTLYVADTGNQVIRAIDLTGGLANATVSTIAGSPRTRGYFGDGGEATAALLSDPRAITACANGDVFIADTGNHRVRRIAAGTTQISTVLGDGTGASSGEGSPASLFPVDAPRGLACDPAGNLLVTSSTSVRLVTRDAAGVDGSGDVFTIFGKTLTPTSPRCLSGLAIADANTVEVTDACSGQLIELHRNVVTP